MRQVLSVSHPRRVPTWRQWQQLSRVLSHAERLLLRGAGGLILCSVVASAVWYISTHRVDAPAVGGEYTEALVGEPQFVNPLYASASDVDADLARLIYSGLVRWDSSQGLMNDLAFERRDWTIDEQALMQSSAGEMSLRAAEQTDVGLVSQTAPAHSAAQEDHGERNVNGNELGTL